MSKDAYCSHGHLVPACYQDATHEEAKEWGLQVKEVWEEVR